jgi:ribonuclease P protein component
VSFAALFDCGNKFHSRRLVVRACANGGASARLGVGISKKRARLAVARSRIRRALAGAFAESVSGLPPLDMLVSVKEDCDKNDARKLAAELRSIFPRIQKYAARHADDSGQLPAPPDAEYYRREFRRKRKQTKRRKQARRAARRMKALAKAKAAESPAEAKAMENSARAKATENPAKATATENPARAKATEN